MDCKHSLGVWADYDGNVHYEFENIDQLNSVDVFIFCPDCGFKLPTPFSLEIVLS